MRGQRKNAAQQATVTRLLAKGWREADIFGLQVTMCYDDRRADPDADKIPRPCMIRVDRAGRVHRDSAMDLRPHARPA